MVELFDVALLGERICGLNSPWQMGVSVGGSEFCCAF